jgi:hypothetical protein
MPADAFSISEARRAQANVAGRGRDVGSSASLFGGDGWLMEHFKTVASAVSDSVVHKNSAPQEKPNVPADSWLMAQAKAWTHEHQRPGDARTNLPPPTMPVDHYIVAQPQRGGQERPPSVIMDSKKEALVSNPLSLFAKSNERTESDRSGSKSTSDSPSDRELPDASDIASDVSDLDDETAASSPSTPPNPLQTTGSAMLAAINVMTGQSGASKAAARNVFSERLGKMQAFQIPAASNSSSSSSSSSSSPAPGLDRVVSYFPWMKTDKARLSSGQPGAPGGTQKDLYRMGRYDRATTNLYGVAPEVVRGTDASASVYQGIDAEIASVEADQRAHERAVADTAALSA